MASLVGMPSESTRYIVGSFLCDCCWIMSIVLVYCLYVFNKIKVLIIYKKRYPFVVKLECVTCLFMCSIIWPLWILHSSQFTALSNLNLVSFLTNFVYILYPFFGYAVPCLEAGRLWVMYYKINHMNAVSNNQWESVIDNTSMMHNWYMTQHATFGKLRWIMKRIFVYYIFASSTSMTLLTNFGFTAYTQCVDCFFYGVPILFILYLYCVLLRNKSLIHDNFLFTLEFTTTNIVFSSGLFLYVFTFVGFALHSYYADMWTAMLGVTVLTGPSVVSALYIPRMILQNSVWSDNDRTIKIRDRHDTVSPGSSAASISPPCPSDTKSYSNATLSYVSSVDKVPKRVHLDEIFTNKVYTQYFIQHIIKEFSLECSLSWIEMRQFGYCLYTKLNAIDVDVCVHPTIKSDIEPLANHIPQSTIVYSEDISDAKDKVMRTFKDKFVALYDKYIDDRAEYQVNISHELRERYDCFKSMHASDSWNVTETELLGVFHEVIMEMRKFMNTSLQRFRKSAEWKQIYKK